MFASGLASLTGASVPSCCQKNAYGLSVLVHTNTSTLVLRFIVMGVLCGFLEKLKHQEAEYHKCRDKGGEKDECDRHLAGDDYARQNYLVGIFIFSLIITLIYILLSASAIFYGHKGHVAENRYAQEHPISRANTDGDIFLTAPPHQATSQMQTVQVVQAQAVPYNPAMAEVVVQPLGGGSQASQDAMIKGSLVY